MNTEEPNYTPGPWCAVEYSGYHELHQQPYYGEASLLNEEECSEAPFNAQLAAAAPDLLEALEILLSDFENCVRCANTQPAYFIAKDAIKKAKGEKKK